MDETWEDVLKDLLEDSNFIFGKADTVDVCLTSSLYGMEAFHPDMTEQIYVALGFDKTLKYVKFIILPWIRRELWFLIFVIVLSKLFIYFILQYANFYHTLSVLCLFQCVNIKQLA